MIKLGKHILAEMYGCDCEILDSIERVELEMKRAAKEANATLVQSVFHKFSPQGVSGVVIIAESHFAIHTWPEAGYAATDFFTCGDEADPYIGMKVIAKALRCKRIVFLNVSRGIFKEGERHPLESSEELIPDD